MSKIARDPLYHRHRFPAEIIAHAVWLYCERDEHPILPEGYALARFAA